MCSYLVLAAQALLIRVDRMKQPPPSLRRTAAAEPASLNPAPPRLARPQASEYARTTKMA
jgi:hypothetical protein